MKRLFRVGSERHDTGKVIFSWHPEGNLLASVGRSCVVQITERHGEQRDSVSLSTTAPVLALEWDKDGEYLAILQDGVSYITFWSSSSRNITSIDVGQKDLSFIAWSKTGPQLAIGNAKGNLVIYHKIKKTKEKIMGKHSKRIISGCWSKHGNRLILGSEDKFISASNEYGESIVQTDLKYVPLQCHFTQTGPARGQDDNIASANLSGKSLLLYNILDEKEDPMELTFAPKENGPGCKYGELVSHCWPENDKVLIGFSGGYVILVSTAPNDLGEEKYCLRAHSEDLINFSYNPQLKKIAIAGNEGIKIYDAKDFKEIKKDYISYDNIENGKIYNISWSTDGQILTVSTTSGNVYNFLAQMTTLHSSYKSTVATLSSLREVTVLDAVKRVKPIEISVDIEPSILAVGSRYIATGSNSMIYYHKIGSGHDEPFLKKNYVGNILDVQLNSTHVAILTDSKAILHPIESTKDPQMRTFPIREEGSVGKATCIALTDNFLFYGTEGGTVEIFFLTENILLSGKELRLTNPIKKIYPNLNGTRAVIVDSYNNVYLYNPVSGDSGTTGSLTQFESAPSNIVKVFWDLYEKHVVLIYDGSCLHTFIYVQNSIRGPLLSKLGPVTVSSIGEITLTPDKTEIPSDFIPIVSYSGTITGQNASGTLTSIIHPFFNHLDQHRRDKKGSPTKKNTPLSKRFDDDNEDEIEMKSNNFCQALALLKLEKAWELAVELDKKSFYLALANKAMELLNVELAYLVYNQLGDAAMTMALKECMQIEDKNQLAGQISLLFCDYQRAQDLFLISSRPLSALEMRIDLLQWEQALKLAEVIDPLQVSEICIRYAQQLEVRDNADKALKMYDRALNYNLIDEEVKVIPEFLVPPALAGIARCNLRLGNIRQGIINANEINDKQLYFEAGQILEQQKHLNEAVSMYVKAEQYEKAAPIYIKLITDTSKIPEAAKILAKVNNNALNIAFGNACCKVGNYVEALKAYERANEYNEIVKIQLYHVENQIQQAFDLIRKNPSTVGALHIVEYCKAQNDYRGTIEFLLLAHKNEEAFKIAQSQSLVDYYAQILGDNISNEDAQRVAYYYSKKEQYLKAGNFYSYAGQYHRSIDNYVKCTGEDLYLAKDAAITVVGKAQDNTLTNRVQDFIQDNNISADQRGNFDFKAEKYLYRLNIVLKKYERAANMALVLIEDHLREGHYNLAHDIVIEIIKYLEDDNFKVPLDLRLYFILIHSYILVKNMIKRGDHLMAARLLLRVAKNISKFPKNTANILTLTVIECQRAGLKGTSYEYAVMLIRSEDRNSIDVQLRRKIEAIVRRRASQVDDENSVEETSLCPISNVPLPVSSLECPTTKDQIPMCIISGKHLVLDDWCFCPISKLPALYSEYVQYIKDELKARELARSKENGEESKNSYNDSELNDTVPDIIYGKPVSLNDLVKSSHEEAVRYLMKYNNLIIEKKKDKEKEGQDSKNNLDENVEEEVTTNATIRFSSKIKKNDRDRNKLRYNSLHIRRKRRHGDK